MSLDGNLRVFSLMEIFQMLGMQRKTGLLAVEGAKDTVTIGFASGRVVSVESTSNPIENRLGSLLVKAGRLSESALAHALEKQRRKPEKLGRLLLSDSIVRAEDVREAFRIQVNRIVLAAFGWTDGRFRFTPEDAVDHDADLFPPLPTESILLEAARTFDELPLAEQKIPSNELVFRRRPNEVNARVVVSEEEGGENAVVVSKREAETWKWIDGRRTVGEIRERAFLSDLDVLKGISDLLDRGLIEEGEVRETPAAVPTAQRRRASLAKFALWVPVLALLALAVSFAPRNPANVLLRRVSQDAPLRGLLRVASQERLLTLARAIHVFYGSTGRYPRSLSELVSSRVIEGRSLTDPFGRPYRYILRPEVGRFALYGRNAVGQIDLDLSHEGTLAPVSELRPGQAQPGTVPDRERGIQVVR